MEIVIVGLNHKTAPIELREKMAFPPRELREPLKRMLTIEDISECLILSTCNRVEVITAGKEAQGVINGIKSFLSEYHSIPADKFSDHLYIYTSMNAVNHLFRVASSLDSMVIGEPQILGQLKDAYREATDYNACGKFLNKLLHHAFRVAKRVRTETEIASSAVSVSYASVELAKKIFKSLKDKVVMLVGAGEMAELAARHFISHGVKKIFITSRTFQRAKAIANSLPGSVAISFETFRRHLADSDIVLSSTGSPEHVIEKEDIKRSMRIRKNRPMFIIDIAVPRDVDPAVERIENVYLYNIDDLKGIVEENLNFRKNESFKAERIIEEEVENFRRWMLSLEVAPTIIRLKERMEEIRKAELQKVSSIIKDLGDMEKEAIEAMTRAIINKILHHPISILKKEAMENGDHTYTEAIRKIFQLDEKESSK
jgi:glutamyl-tRNA reductase